MTVGITNKNVNGQPPTAVEFCQTVGAGAGAWNPQDGEYAKTRSDADETRACVQHINLNIVPVSFTTTIAVADATTAQTVHPCNNEEIQIILTPSTDIYHMCGTEAVKITLSGLTIFQAMSTANKTNITWNSIAMTGLEFKEDMGDLVIPIANVTGSGPFLAIPQRTR